MSDILKPSDEIRENGDNLLFFLNINVIIIIIIIIIVIILYLLEVQLEVLSSLVKV